jgi:hypothetical protein
MNRASMMFGKIFQQNRLRAQKKKTGDLLRKRDGLGTRMDAKGCMVAV